MFPAIGRQGDEIGHIGANVAKWAGFREMGGIVRKLPSGPSGAPARGVLTEHSPPGRPPRSRARGKRIPFGAAPLPPLTPT